jgi:GMP synthase (glutamine-hydrolysing)
MTERVNIGQKKNAMNQLEHILILDFGSQYTQLIARRVRECNVYCEIHPFHKDIEEIREAKPKGIILSGGPASVYDKESPRIDKALFELGIPVLGICYGAQLMTELLGGIVAYSDKREFGYANLSIDDPGSLLARIGLTTSVWMSHADKITRMPPNFVRLAHTDNCPIAAMRHQRKPFFGVQFHPEVVHTPEGVKILEAFLVDSCGCRQNWTMESFVDYAKENIRKQVGDAHVICGLSGGVDSSVVSVLLHEAIGDQLTCIFVNNGVLRKNEADAVIEMCQEHFQMKVVYVDAEEQFLSALKGVTDPEQKRKLIGNIFIDVFDKESQKISNVKFLAQGTLYPDVIESVSVKGPSAVIKSHHNVGGLPEKMNLDLVEPVRELFKDEVRALGLAMGIDESVIWRQPFPGPGLAIRIMGEVTQERLDILREADALILEEIKAAGLYRDIWQSFAVLLPVKTVGVMGDTRTYENVLAIRAVESKDGMTANWVHLDYEVLGHISTRIINEVKGINRVVYDISSKPPATIEWE